ncbi:MAG: DUF6477 family protein [Paracoccus sp. (in: a-proteobacteria)]|uniref:DUF6477 family protein n=1 Tax=Paracoccus sp. TaxID=267 RepID=UPI0039E62ECD
MTMMPNVIHFQPRPMVAGLATPMHRPRLLVRAARAGLPSYSRKRDLRRVLKCDELPLAGQALSRLVAEEDRLDQARREKAADYDIRHHLLVLIALIAEAVLAMPCPITRNTAARTGTDPITFPGKASRARP